MAGIQDYMIYEIITQNEGKATKQEIFDKLGKDRETKRVVEEKLAMMERFGLITIDGNLVTLKKK